jgi:(R,R)-butanediol dehydrogenase / meso-butanediol dehydrogenase / diacetyl reductase
LLKDWLPELSRGIIMKVLQFVEVGKPLQIADVPRPNAGPGGLIFKVKACGICGSDLHAVEVPGLLHSGNVLGHEYSGEVVEVGPGSEGWNIGDRLVALPAKPCGACHPCQVGRHSECSQIIMQGFDLRMPGAYAEYSSCMAGLAIKVSDVLSDNEAATIEPLAVGLNAWKTAKVEAGASILIVGGGVIGLTLAKWARFFGAGDIGISEMVPARLARARSANLDVVIDAAQCANPVAEFERQTGRKPSVIFECVGRPMIAKLIEMAPSNAHLVLVGTGMQPENFTVISAALKRLRMTFPIAYVPSDFHFVQRMLTARRVTVDGLITATVSLDEAPAMFEELGKPNEHCKVLIAP